MIYVPPVNARRFGRNFILRDNIPGPDNDDTRAERRKKYSRELEKVLGIMVVNGKVFCTCNMEAIHKCDLMGREREIESWKVDFFIRSQMIVDKSGMIFSSRPGRLLSDIVSRYVRNLYLFTGDNTMVNIRTGRYITADTPIVFSEPELFSG
jgi:hypothetical protein